MKECILVVDDERDICDILQFNLKINGYDVETANSGEEAVEKILGQKNSYNLILLDVMMDEMSGFEVAQRLKATPRTKEIPIIFLTAKDTENDIITGLNIGADDYISKPFSLQEVILRVKAVLRRTTTQQPDHPSNRLSFCTMVLDLDKKTVTIDGADVPFTKTEYELLRLLLRRRGQQGKDAQRLGHPELNGPGGGAGEKQVLQMGQRHIQRCQHSPVNNMAGVDFVFHGGIPPIKNSRSPRPSQKMGAKAPIRFPSFVYRQDGYELSYAIGAIIR